MSSIIDTGKLLVSGISEFFSGLSEDSDEIALEIEGQVFSGWKGLSLSQALDDMVSTVGIEGPFNPDNEELQSVMEPFTYKEATLYIGRDRIATTTIEKHSFNLDDGSRSCKMDCRSPAGVLCDTYIEAETAQYTGLTLKQLLETITQPFGDRVSIEYKAEKNPTFGTVRLEAGKSYFDFIKELWEPLGLIATDDEYGRLVITEKPEGTGDPVFSFIEGKTDFSKISAEYAGDERFSFYIVYGNYAGQNFKSEASDPVINASVFRPCVKIQKEGENNTIETAAAWERALALSRSIKVTLTLPGWRRGNGGLWRKGDIVTVKAPSVFLYNETKMIVSSLAYTLTDGSKDTTMSLILPQTYTSELPEVYPWD